MLRIQIDTLLASIFSLGLLFIPLSGSADAGLRPLYWSCVNGSCEPTAAAGRDGDGNLLLGYIKESAEPGTVPLYWACAYRLFFGGGCGQQKLVAQPRYDDAVLLGYIAAEAQPGTRPLYWSCRQRDANGECIRLAPDHSASSSARDSALLGYVYGGGKVSFE
jgi:hypothetical protein